MNYRIVIALLLAVNYAGDGIATDKVSADGFQRRLFDDPETVSKHWKTMDRNGETLAFDEIVGRPSVIVLFRGHGCYHCVQQLSELVKIESRFRSRGVRLIAVSNESASNIDEALRNRPLPFPVLSDDESILAKALGSEEMDNWHGILLLDPEGKARWLLSGPKARMDFREVMSQIDALINTLTISQDPIATHHFESTTAATP